MYFTDLEFVANLLAKMDFSPAKHSANDLQNYQDNPPRLLDRFSGEY
jgi:hypothetical protein